jgi:hypothetical protein
MKRIITGLAVAAGLAFAAAPADASQITGTAAPGFINADAMSIFDTTPSFVSLDFLGVTSAQEATCSTLLLNGCLYTMDPTKGIVVNNAQKATIIYTDATLAVVAAVFGIQCVGPAATCTDVLAFVAAKPGAGALDLSILGALSQYDYGILGSGPGGTSFSADAYLTPGEKDSGLHAVFTAANVTVPEPITLSLFGAGLAGAAAMRRRKRT